MGDSHAASLKVGDLVFHTHEAGATVTAIVIEERDANRYLIEINLEAGQMPDDMPPGLVAYLDKIRSAMAAPHPLIDFRGPFEVDGATLTLRHDDGAS
jgi:hypothetical protein